MVTEARAEHRIPDARDGGVAARFRPLGGGSGSGPERAGTPPEFTTAPWGYRRAEVDAWAAWVAGLLAQGQRETVRADSAEATLRATLERLEELERRLGDVEAPELPRRTTEPAEPTPPRTEDAPQAPPTAPDGPAPDQHEPVRLQIVQSTLRDMMSLLRQLADPDPSRPAERPGGAPPEPLP